MTATSPRARASRARAAAAPAAALVIAALMAAAGCTSGSPGDGTPIATTTVDLPKSYRFAPAAITVEVGSTVTWTNSDNFSHNVDLADDPAPPLSMAPGDQVTYTFERPGTYAYVCSLHPNDMTGTVVVTGS